MNFQEFAQLPNLSSQITPLDRRYDSTDHDQWSKDATHWQIIVRWKQPREMPYGAKIKSHALEYSMGSAHKGNPVIADVLNCLHLDASCAINSGSFEDWADDLGYDSDSRKAEKVYRSCLATADALLELFGGEVFDQFLACEEE